MKFDVIVGNPPYQTKSENSVTKTEPIWHKFIDKSFDLLKDDGYLCLVHPSNWRNAKSKFDNIKIKLLSKQIEYLSLNDFDKGMKIFGVGTNFDWYVIKNTSNNKKLTKIVTSNGREEEININDMPFIPNDKFKEFENLIGNINEDRVNVLFDRTMYGNDKLNMSKTKDNKYKFPCVYTITKKTGINLWYSSENKGHFGIPKVIWSNGLGTYPIIDKIGEYGITNFAAAIVDSIENLDNIKKALDNPKFLELMKYVKFKNDIYDYRVIATFRKDFWKQFID